MRNQWRWKILSVSLIGMLSLLLTGCGIIAGLIASTPTASPAQLSCAGFALTSPQVDLPLPDGEVTFTWTAVDNAATYRLSILEGDVELRSFEVDGTMTSLPVDVSPANLGGGSILTVQVEAHSSTTGAVCEVTASFQREAPPPSGPCPPGSC